MFSLNDKISLKQLQVLIILDIFGTGIIILPVKAASYAGRDGWLAVLVSLGLAIISVSLITALIRLFPGKSFYEYASLLVTKPVAFILNAVMVMKIIVSLACELRFFGEIVKHLLLYNTPFLLISASLLIVSAYAAGKGIETRGRIGQVIIWFIFLPLIFVFALVCTDVDFSAILPVLQTPKEDIAKGGFYCFFAFTGIDFLLLVSPYINSNKALMRRSLVAVIVTGIFMAAVTLITICRFGAVNIINQTWPVLEMMDAIDLPGSFIERQEALIMSFWILSVFATVSAGLYYSSVALKSAIKAGKHFYYLVAVAAATFVLSYLLKNINTVYEIMDLLFLYTGTAYMLIIPAILLIIACLRGYKYEKTQV